MKEKSKWFIKPKNFSVSQVETMLVNIDVNAKMIGGNTLLHLAVLSSNYLIAKLLIESKADVNLVNKEKHTPIYLSATSNKPNITLLLIKNGAELDAGVSWVHAAAKMGNIQIMKFLIDKGFDINLLDDNKQAPIHYARWRENEEMEQYLVEKGSIILEPIISYVPISKSKPSLKVVTEILETVNVNQQNSMGRTMLHMAVLEPNYEVVELLIKRGADLNIVSNAGDMPIYLSAFYGNPNITLLLMQNGATLNGKIDWCCRAAAMGDIEIMEFLIDKGYDINALDSFKVPPLHYARINNNTEMVQYLIEKGGITDYEVPNLGEFESCILN